MRLKPLVISTICALVFSTQLPIAAQAADGDAPAPTTTKSAKNIDTELVKARALIESKKYAPAITELKKLNKTFPNNADVNNLLGFASRKLSKYKDAETYYKKALKIKPNHLGALEYQGELFVLTNKSAQAKANLAKLKKACGISCEEYLDLEKSINAKK
jgi:Flp pilus assembly protein TadD